VAVPTVSSAPASSSMPPAPSPRRLSRPRWLNVRVVGGILLVIAAVVVGARVIGGSARTIGVWAADRNLAAGTVLTAEDLSTAEVNLGDNADLYITSAAESPIGLTVVTPLHAGELLAASAVEESASGRVVAVGVEPNNMPPGVGHGSIIDLYLTTGGAAGTGGTPTTERIGKDITVQSVTAPATGGLSGATSNRYQVSVMLPAADADKLVRTLPNGEPIVVLVSGEGG
jgi:hypothetical protein